jgi:acyl carrier protein
MTPISEGELVDQIIKWIRENKRDGSAHVEISEDTDLITTGLLDSLGVVDLFMFIESITGCKIDLTDVDLGEISAPKGLSRVALNSYSLT